MKLELQRKYYKQTYTIGNLYIDGLFFCNTLEDIPRVKKITNETCIPTGAYRVILNMSNRFKRIMPLLLFVPGFDGIRIHAGNTDKDTSGCILVGKNTLPGRLTNSKETFEKLMEILLNSKDEIVIEVGLI